MTIAIEPLTLSGKDYIRILPLRYNQNLKGILERIPGYKWDKNLGWHVPKTLENWQLLQKLFGHMVYDNYFGRVATGYGCSIDRFFLLTSCEVSFASSKQSDQ